MNQTILKEHAPLIRDRLGTRTITLVGLMGAGKSAIGRKIAAILRLPFIDADTEIEAAAKMAVTDIFENYGEPEFRRVEVSVIKRVLENGPQILATGGGAFMNKQTQTNIHESGISLWLDADIDLLMERVSKKSTRPLLKKPNPRGIMLDLMKERYPIYAQAEITIKSDDISKDEMAARVITKLAEYMQNEDSSEI